ncbi:MAG: rod shape-determining protein MreD [Desulfobacterales bacterium]
MSYFFNISVCLFLLILQTAIVPVLPLLDRFYDLMIPFVVYLGLSRPVRESLIFVFLLGLVMDNLSGSPVGLYLTTYFWLFVGVKGLTKVLQVGNRLFIIMLIVAAGVLIENLIFLGTLTILGPDQQLADNAARSVTVQVLWAIWTGPIFLLIFRNIHQQLDLSFKAIYARKD